MQHLPGDAAMQYAGHLRDLALIALGGRDEGQEIAKGRGARAARLAALKRDIAAHFADSELTLDMLAQRHNISPSYIRALFGDEGTAFSDYVRAQRLQKAWAMIAAPDMAQLLISTIAFRRWPFSSAPLPCTRREGCVSRHREAAEARAQAAG
ncbi:hypothetical protein KUG85_05960 [Nitratireductor sp. L1-7-SE]|uniref:HTH araC/xylS-type domain-containing protein n=1 Tax=Nitratireductor rhodophyticola TaxID=2854036 RepID=A0ABS7RAC6_9HYPH|nr:hypothetical protein [Nitratireductor rhodophyticola]MBY8917335.1 hypothetical protein [Nitratireductor rhodophyticola]MBY8920236.1 hypothetical protein [Nitratireductor rhodophyticola]